MTPKEKAIELYVKYRQYTFYIDLVYKDDTLDKFYENAKSCALIAVDEILNVIVGTYDFDTLNEYWQEVKQEIKKL